MESRTIDSSPETWVSPENDPGFPEPYGPPPHPEDTDNPIGIVHYADADEMHRQTIDAIGALDGSMRRLIETLTDVGKEVIEIVGGASMSSHVRMRLRRIIISRATVGNAVLGIGTRSYTFTVDAAPREVNLPLLIERGVDVSYTGDGRIYLIHDPE